MQDFDNLGAEDFFLICILIWVSKQSISSFVSLALMIINLEVVVRELLGPTDFSGAQALYLYKPSEVVVVDENKYLMLRPF